MCITFSQDQLNDAIESKKDVTKTGMTGFYSNLLTKNIATGADAEVHATSAYTAGGKRIDNALAIDRDKGRSTRDTSDRSDKSDDTVKRSEKRDRHGNDDSEVGVKREKHDHNSDSFPTKETGSNNSAGKNLDESTRTEIKKEVKITSARERYLARKLQQESGTAGADTV